MIELIQPAQTGAQLLTDIQQTSVAGGAVAIWWLGQSGYAIKTASTLLYIDLYLSEHLTAKYANTDKPHIRMTAAPLRGADLSGVQWLFASHKHSDHLDPGTAPDVLRASPDARLILPVAIADQAVSLGLARERLLLMRGDDSLRLGPLTVHSIPAAHPTFEYTEAGGYPFLGFVFQMDGLTVYHSGDTLVYAGLAERLRTFQPDIMFLPINGTDERRNAFKTPPNMNMQEALALAEAVGPRLLIPHHYDMFTFNTADVGEFELLAAPSGVPYAVLRPGARFEWRRPG